MLTAIVLSFLFFSPLPVHAAITEAGPPIDAFFAPDITVGGGAVFPLLKFRLSQAAGSDTLSKIGVQLFASSTVTQGEVSRISLWQESGTAPDFQLGQDTPLPNAASTSPMVDGTLIVLQSVTPVSVGSAGAEFYIVASTTAAAGITNGHAFDVRMQNNYASTTAGGIGNAFIPGKKIFLNQSATLKISEVRAGSTGNTADEFIELYNTGEADIDLPTLPLNVHTFYASGSSSPVALTYYKRIIPSHGYFLIGSQVGYNGAAQPDAVFATSSFSVLVPHGGFSIATTSGTTATSSAIDYIGWGDQPAGNCENSDTVGTVCAPALAEDGTSLERLAQGYPNATSTAASMTAGGQDATKGNSIDNKDNSAEFVAQTTANPQNSMSPKEFAFSSGPGGNQTTLRVDGSYPSDNMQSVPVDLPYVGFNFSKPIATTTVISASATTTVTLKQGGTGANLCTSVTHNPFPGNFEPSTKCILLAQLSPSVSYTFTVTSDVQDLSGNQLDQNSFTAGNQNYTATFTAGGASQTSTNVTPPQVVGTSPFNGSLNVPTNLARMSVEFNQSSIDTSTLTADNIGLSSSAGNIALSGFSFATSSGKNILSFVPASLAANTAYSLIVRGGVKNTNNVNLPTSYSARFTTGNSTDATAPAIVGILPTPNATISANTNDFIFTFDDDIDVTTATSGSVTLGIVGGANLPGTVRYDPVAKEGHFIPSNILPVGQSIRLTLVGASIKNVSGVTLGTNVTRNWTVEAANSDSTGPTVLFAGADNFSLSITFDEAVNSNDASTLGNYSLTIGGVSQTLSALAGHALTYDAAARTAKLSGIQMASNASFTITAQNIKDISGNAMSGTSSFTGSVESIAASGGFTGPGSFQGSTFGESKDFSAAGIGFMPPVTVRAQNSFVSASTTYQFELPIATQIPASGTIVITFPSSSDFGLCCAATSTTNNPFVNDQNKDINGPGPNAIGIKTITRNATAKTVTLTLDTATRSENSDTHDFLRFILADLKNPSIPKGFDSSGYTLDIKSKNASGTLLESFNANPVYVTGGGAGGGATTTIHGTVTGNGGNLQGVAIHLMSPQTGPMDATTNSDGLYQFTNIPVGSQFLSNNFGGGNGFFVFTDPFVNPTGTTTAFFGDTMPTPVSATSTSLLTRNFALTATSSAINFDVKVTASAATFSATEQVDVFAGGPGQFVVRTVTPGAGALSAATVTTIPIPQQNGFWGIGMGPAMPKGTGGGFSGPPPSPSWSMPKPIEVTVSGCPSACGATVNGASASSHTFSISAADKTIAGVLKDGSGNAIANAMIFAFSVEQGTGNFSQTSASGAFSISVAAGSYSVGASTPGLGNAREVSVVVNSSGSVFVNGSLTASTGASGANPFVLKMNKPSYTITGRVSDGTNAVGNAPVFAYRTDAPGHVDAMSDSSTGNYTLYVDNGTWKIGSFIPGFGPMAEQTVTISGANQTDINFAPSSSQSFSMLSGNIYEDADNDNTFDSNEGISGAVIRLSGTSGSNEGVSGSDGVFSLRVPSGSGYQIADVFKPGYGRIAPLKDNGTAIGAINLTASTTQNIRVATRKTITINIKDSSGNKLVVPKAFIDLFDTTTRLGNHAEITNASSTTLQIPNGASTTIRAFVHGVPSANIAVASDDTDNTLVLSGVLQVNGNETVKITVDTSTASLSTISGKIYHTAATSGNELESAWIQFIDETNGVNSGTQATTSGAYSLTVANGTYNVLVSRPGYVGTPTTVTVSGNATQNFVLTSASLTIAGQVTAGGSAATDAFVRAEKIGGGQAITTTDTSGNYTLSVSSGTWRIFAAADGYAEAGYASNPLTVNASQTGITIALSTTVSLQSKLAQSNTFTDSSAATFNDSTVNVNVELDANALGSSGNNSYITARETSNFPNTTSVNVVASKAKDINAFSGGSKVSNLQSGKKATVEVTYTTAELASSDIDTTSEVTNLKVVSYSETLKDWESLSTVPTYKDSSGSVVASPSSNLSNVASVTFTAVGTHFSLYALSASTGTEPPSTPGGVTATAGNPGSQTITISWGSVSGATGYYVYRDTDSGGSFALLANAGNVTSYSNTSVTNGTTYYYKIGAYKSGGSAESAASSAVSAKVSILGGGGVIGGGGGGGGGGAGIPASQTVFIPGTASTQAAAAVAAAAATPATPATPSAA
ncbi:MAG: carboxypeptidase regulatory-like domain-containing protein, partial [Parcubacteria group bacterium]|nr:carboxypeptidase regulatory-like domain-containing protein [Parcubacteria group bacterium]